MVLCAIYKRQPCWMHARAAAWVHTWGTDGTFVCFIKESPFSTSGPLLGWQRQNASWILAPLVPLSECPCATRHSGSGQIQMMLFIYILVWPLIFDTEISWLKTLFWGVKTLFCCVTFGPCVYHCKKWYTRLIKSDLIKCESVKESVNFVVIKKEQGWKSVDPHTFPGESCLNAWFNLIITILLRIFVTTLSHPVCNCMLAPWTPSNFILIYRV